MNATTIKARRKRLLALADFLEGTVLPMLDGAKFNMSTWGKWRRDDDEPRSLGETSECGFQGCAVGWGYYCEPLRKAGLRKLVKRDRPLWEGEKVAERQVWDDGALQDFFGLTTENEFSRAFLGGGRGPSGVRAVVKRLRRLASAKPDTPPTGSSDWWRS